MWISAWRACLLRALGAFAIVAAEAAAQDVSRREETPQEIFERAMRERERGDLHEAIRSFHAILDEHPGLNRARVELAVAYYHAMDYQAALEQARRVLADPATPPAVRGNVQRLIAQIEVEAQPHRFSGFSSIGLLHDSNVSVGPASPSYEVGGNLLSLDPKAVKRSDNALTVTLGGSHRYLSGIRPGIGGRDGALLWQSQALFNRVGYRNETAYDLQVLTLTTGPAWISPPRLRASAPLQFDRLDLGSDHYIDILGVSPAVVFGGPASTEVQVDARLQNRAYKRPIDGGRDSRYHSFGLQAGRVTSAMTLQAGARLNRDHADERRWNYRGSEWFGLVARHIAERTTGYLRFTYLRNGYDQRDPVTGTGRTDRETRLALGASYRFGTGSDDPWSANVTLLDIRHRSDVPFYAFNRSQLSFTVTRAF
jgi:tetratricopeptide (TPR) repeat protein